MSSSKKKKIKRNLSKTQRTQKIIYKYFKEFKQDTNKLLNEIKEDRNTFLDEFQENTDKYMNEIRKSIMEMKI